MEKGKGPLVECHISTGTGEDNFVGIRSDGERIQACFPIGYRLGGTEAEREKDIRLLIRVLSRFMGVREKLLPQSVMGKTEAVSFPVQAYLTVLDAFYARGYYTENERIYKVGGNGRTSWARTVKTQRPYPQNGSLVYPRTVVRESRPDSVKDITRIHEFCVHEAYRKVGFLFPANEPRKPSIGFDGKRFLAVLGDRLRNENNDRNKALFSGMIDMIRYVGAKGDGGRFFYGTYHFEYVWERLIDFNFGIDNKGDYFPRASWYLLAEGRHVSFPLEPDTVMKEGDRVYILDAKYYRYGESGDPSHLPPSTSVNKQITYGEYVATAPKFKDAQGKSPTVYNVFLMPFNMDGGMFRSGGSMCRIGEARGDWKASGASYERVQGVLLDVKWMMGRTMRQNQADIGRLARLVETGFAPQS